MSIKESEKKLLKELGGRVHKLRMSKNWTLEEAEEHGWPSWRHLQLIESGKKNVSFITLNRLATLFDIKLSDLTKGL